MGDVSVVNDGHADSRFQGLVSAKRRFDRLPQTGLALRCVPAYAGDGYVVRGIIFHVSVEWRMSNVECRPGSISIDNHHPTFDIVNSRLNFTPKATALLPDGLCLS